MIESGSPLRTLLSASDRRRAVLLPVTYASASLARANARQVRENAEAMADCLARAFELCRYDGVYCGWEASFYLLARALGVPFSDPPDALPGPIPARTAVREPPAGWLERDPAIARQLEVVALLHRRLGGAVPLLTYVPGPFTLAAVVTGGRVLRAMLDLNLTEAWDLLALATCASADYARLKIARGCEIAVVADPAASESVLQPAKAKSYALPSLRELARAIAEAGAVCSLHICGYSLAIIDEMADTGAAILEIDSAVSLPAAVARAGGRVCLQGNLDPRRVAGASEAEVRTMVRACLAEASQAPRFIASTGCELPPGTPLENLRAFVDEVRASG
jgi:MtaA/CmuA family methyltransferase